MHRNSDGHLVSDERLARKRSASWAAVTGTEYRWNQRHSFVLESGSNYPGWATNDPDFSEPSNGVVAWYHLCLLSPCFRSLDD
ncbi:DUF3187 family protein [Vibrio chagasii]|nr:DUF3187 family protein [Vibrio chagasii]